MKYIIYIAQLIRAFIVLFLCLQAGIFLAQWIPLPSSIIGMMLLFLGLTFHIIPEDWVSGLCTLFGRYMALFFVPVCIGVMAHYNTIKNALFPLLMACTISSLLVMILVGYGIEWSERRNHSGNLKKEIQHDA